MKILILANNDIGLYKFRKELIESLLFSNEVYISSPLGDYIERLKKMGCKYIDTSLSRRSTNPIKDLKLFVFYKRIIKSIRPDVVLTYTIKPNIYGGLACKKLGVKYISNITGLGTAIEKKSFTQKIALFLYRKALSRSKMVFFQNQSNLDFMKNKRIISDNYCLIPGSGVNLKQYELFDYPNDDYYDFIYVARIMKEKGIDQLLEAAKSIVPSHPRVRFHVCGFCEQDYEKILEEYSRNNFIIYHGLVDDMQSLYKKCCCIVHPTFYPEGLSNVLLEASAVGRPIIATDRPGCREIVIDGFNGFLIKEQDSNDLIDKINTFISLPYLERKKMGLNARKVVEDKFDRNIVVNRYLEEIEKE